MNPGEDGDAGGGQQETILWLGEVLLENQQQTSLSEGISLPRKGCLTAQHHSFINQRHFYCPFTATQLLRLSLADSSLIHLPGEGEGPAAMLHSCCRSCCWGSAPWTHV